HLRVFHRHAPARHQETDSGKDDSLRVRERVDRGAARQALGQVLSDGDSLRHLRRGSGVHLSLGHPVSIARLDWLADDALVPRHLGAGARLLLEERSPGMGEIKGTETRVLEGGEQGFATTRLDALLGWARKYSLFMYPFVTACCGMEFFSMTSPRYDVSRFGAEAPRFSPRQSDLLWVVGTISQRQAPV